MYRFISLLILMLLFTNPVHAKLYINEFMASNDVTIADEFDEYDDWLEIYNSADYAVSLATYYLTDDLDNPTKWSFPDVTIPAKGFLLIWVDKDPEQGELHTTFKLSSGGEQIGIYDGTSYVDSLTFGEQRTDVSYGRYPDGGDQWYFFQNSTPEAPNDYQSPKFVANPQANPPRGFYNGAVDVELSVASMPTAQIYYTTDGSDPTTKSELYSGPISITKTTVLRAKAFMDGYSPSEIVTHSYVLNYNFNFATVSVVTDPDNLWDEQIGIYVNPFEHGEDWERPIVIELFDKDGELCFSENAGIRIHGDQSREYRKKSFRVYFRNEYGHSWLNYPLFEVKSDVNDYKRLILHCGSTDTPSNPFGKGWTMLRDPLVHELGRRANAYYTASHPVALFLNGERWGIYNLIERIDKYFIEKNFDETDIDLIQNGTYAKEGDMTKWNEMINFFERNGLGSDVNYEQAQKMLDIDNFTNYCIIEIYSGNEDWPNNNQFAFRPRRSGALWRWILWDLDGCFGPYGIYSNTLEWAVRDDESTVILRNLIDNKKYRYLFINRFSDLLNTIFQPAAINELIDSLSAIISDDITFETDKWGSSPEAWIEDGVDGELREFANRRPDVVRSDIKEQFNLSGTYTLTLGTPTGGEGKVRVNSVYIKEFPWSGIYFDHVPIELEAIPYKGYKFKRWSQEAVATMNPVTLNLSSDYTIYPIFEYDNTVVRYDLVINEINYNSSPIFDPKDWIELYNFSNEAIDVSGWHFKDSDDAHDFIIPANTTIGAKEFLVLCRDSSAFHGLFPAVDNYIGDFNFGLSSNGEIVRLYDSAENLVDSLEYGVASPWPSEPNGGGATLELLAPTLDNRLPQSWRASNNFGTPGRENQVYVLATMIAQPDSLYFTAEEGAGQLEPQEITIASKDSGVFVWTATEEPNCVWLSIKNPIGSSGEKVVAYVDVTGMSAGFYEGNICVRGTNTANDSINIPVILEITEKPEEYFFAQFKAKESGSLPNIGWLITNNEGEDCIMALRGDISSPPEDYRLDYSFKAPETVDKVYIFAEIDVNASPENDAFWIKLNGEDLCNWDNLSSKGDGWQRSWIYNFGTDSIHEFNVNTGVNIVSIYPRKDGGYINWLVITDNPDVDIDNYEYQVPDAINDGDNSGEKDLSIPAAFCLKQNNPNPFNPITNISFDLPLSCRVQVTIYNALGQQVCELVNKPYPAGSHSITWNASDERGYKVKSGIYFAELKAGNYRQVIKMMLLK